MAFKIPTKASSEVKSPEEMFDEYKNRTIKGLISHQADILREYEAKAVNEANIALQLPTGSGKTLVGLLLAEWRRKKFGERVVYLCPTKQLANQVAEQGIQKYGIRTTVFTGPIKEYSPASKYSYQNSETVAVSTYHALFNSNPFFSDPNVVILDDAHVAENYISSFWSIEIKKEGDDCAALFSSLAGIIKPYISTLDFNRMLDSKGKDSAWIEKLPSPFLWKIHNEIVSAIDEHIVESQKRFAWQEIRSRILACQLYYSQESILIRPLILPTLTHGPFASAKQRIFMSATLGEGGDLERMFGIRSISRLAVSKKWETTAIGRRLFFFPDHSLPDVERDVLVGEMVEQAGRAVVLVPSLPAAMNANSKLRALLTKDFQFFDARQIEDSKKNFIDSEKAVAVIANRYDGIDFEQDECRLLIISGFPRSLNMQEEFLGTRLGAKLLLLDRRITRITQALGRCTRAENDYSAVVITGPELGDVLVNKERRKHLHPEIQSEIEFGIVQSKDAIRSDFTENLRLFLEHGDEWDEAEKHITNQKNEYHPLQSLAIQQLAALVKHEVDYQYAMWKSDYSQAFEHAREVVGNLKASELQGYRTLWNYLVGAALVFHEWSKGESVSVQSLEHFKTAAKSNLSISWFSRVIGAINTTPMDNETNDEKLLKVIEKLENKLEKLGVQHNRQFSSEVETILKGIEGSESKAFENAQVRLGALLGYESGKKEEDASPDPWWILADDLYIVFEDHSGGYGNSPFSATKARQACSHPNWVRANLNPKENARIIPVLISPSVRFEDSALPHLEIVKFWPLEEYRSWVANVVALVRELRTSFKGAGDLAWRSNAIERYKALNLDPEGMCKILDEKSYKRVMLQS